MRRNIWILALLIVAALILAGCGKKTQKAAPSKFSVDTKDSGKIVVKAETAASGSAGTGHLTLEEGQQMRVVADFQKGSVKVKMVPVGEAYAQEPPFEETFNSIDAEYYALPAGEYSVEVSAEKGTTGILKIEPGGNVTIGGT